MTTTSVSDGRSVTVGPEVIMTGPGPGRLAHMWDTHGWVLQWKWRWLGLTRGAFSLSLCGASVLCCTRASDDLVVHVHLHVLSDGKHVALHSSLVLNLK